MQMNYFCIVTLLCLIFLDGTTSYVYPNKETTCQRELRIYQQEPNVPGRRKPVCDNLGNYAHKQCIGSQCNCVLKNGTHIPGFYFNNWEAEQQTCYCAREQAEYEATGLVGKMFRCTNDGSYDSIQCTGQYCYCAWHGKQIGESSVNSGVHITEINSLNCIFGKETTCQRELRIYRWQPKVPGRRIPVCDSRGNYAHKQCSGSQCYCVLKNGTPIPGFYVNAWKAEQQTCYCAREQAEYEATGLVGKMFRCTNDGSYDSIQCTGSHCYCADQNGKQIGESSVHNEVHITEINSLNCIFGKETACQREPHVPGRRTHVCDFRGNYAHKQCSGSQCYCVLKNGTPIPGFYVNVWKARQQTCYCAREQAEYEATGLVGKMFRCTKDGSYDSIQCTGSHCYCADQNGKQLWESSVHITKTDILNCYN